jgi:hypothetical protein
MEGGILTHKHDSRDWKLRRFRDNDDNHPTDPSWESGSYVTCHADARAIIQHGVMIFDTVYVDGKGIVRSAFEVTGSEGQGENRVLHFKKFWYPGPNARPVTLLNTIHSTRYPEKRTKEQVESIIHEMHSSGYIEYQSGQTPPSPNVADWKAMIDAARKDAGHKHKCP